MCDAKAAEYFEASVLAAYAGEIEVAFPARPDIPRAMVSEAELSAVDEIRCFAAFARADTLHAAVDALFPYTFMYVPPSWLPYILGPILADALEPSSEHKHVNIVLDPLFYFFGPGAQGKDAIFWDVIQFLTVRQLRCIRAVFDVLTAGRPGAWSPSTVTRGLLGSFPPLSAP